MELTEWDRHRLRLIMEDKYDGDASQVIDEIGWKLFGLTWNDPFESEVDLD